MARKPRICFPGAAYHVMSRGNGGADIFYGDKDRSLLLSTLDEACGRFRFEIHAFVLMRNHYHFLLVTPDANLVEGMKWFNGTYTQRFNARHRRRGHLFQGRYRAQNIESDSDEHYFRAAANYIHLNPSRARLLGRGQKRRELASYRWSSVPIYLGPKQNRPPWLIVDRVLAEHGYADTLRGRRAYAAVLEQRIAGESGDEAKVKELDDQVRRGWALGGESFMKRMTGKVSELAGQLQSGSLDGEGRKAAEIAAAERIVKRALQALSVRESELANIKKTDLRKAAVVWALKTQTAVSNDWIRERLCMGHATNVSNAARIFREGRKHGEAARLRKRLSAAGILKSKD